MNSDIFIDTGLLVILDLEVQDYYYTKNNFYNALFSLM